MKVIESQTLFDENVIKKLQVLFKEKKVKFSIVFGSLSRGEGHKHSDIDIAIYTGLPKAEHLKYQMTFISELQEILNKSVDVVVLDEVSIILAHKIIKDGILLYEDKTHEGEYKKFVEFVISRYPDFHLFLERFYQDSLGEL
ncbi:MAG: type VII toxin-antitoxin system MntA family adenylyltransferase antitoxin [Candidatus Hodarchaeales archaeon]|jgi:predicted nucleotidyltransferase